MERFVEAVGERRTVSTSISTVHHGRPETSIEKRGFTHMNLLREGPPSWLTQHTVFVNEATL
jgi:hypothetical protein